MIKLLGKTLGKAKGSRDGPDDTIKATERVSSWQSTNTTCLTCKNFNFSYDMIQLRDMEMAASAGCCYCAAILTGLLMYAEDRDCQNADEKLDAKYHRYLTPETLRQKDMIRFERVWLESATASTVRMSVQSVGFDLELFAASQDNPFDLAVAPTISGDTSSSRCLAQLQTWLQDCLSRHGPCNIPPTIRRRPRRILDISRKRAIKLIDNWEALSPYICLSHCWGTNVPIRTTTANFDKFQVKVPWEQLPRTFQEAVILSKKLDIKYLWIDSLCIIQDNATDWEIEAAKMASIYESARLTIAATHAADSTQGLFSKPPSSHLFRKFACHGPDGAKHTLGIRRKIPHLPPTNYTVHVDTSTFHHSHPLMGRGWAYQERLLSRRVVHFCASEIVWECMDETRCECSQAMEPDCGFHIKKDHATNGNASFVQLDSDVGNRWRRMVREYCQNRLTYEEDIFPALAGLARQMAERKQRTRYLAGLWEDTLLQDLLWSATWPSQRPSQWRAPTWSWASILGPITYRSPTGMDVDGPLSRTISRTSSFPIQYGQESGIIEQPFWYATVESSECIPAGIDPYGKVAYGKLTIQGYMKRCTLVTTATTRDLEGLALPDSTLLQSHHIKLDCPTESAATRVPVYCFKMGRRKSTSLDAYECILMLLSCQSNSTQEYERVGIVSIMAGFAEACDEVLNDGRFCRITLT